MPTALELLNSGAYDPYAGVGPGLYPVPATPSRVRKAADVRREGHEEAVAAREGSANRIRNGVFDFLTRRVGLKPEQTTPVLGAADVLPGIGDIAGLEDSYQAGKAGEWGKAVALGGLGVLGMLPGADLLTKPLTKAPGAVKGVERAIEASKAVVPAPGQTPQAAMLLSQLPEAQRALVGPRQEGAFLRAAQTQDPRELAAMTLAGAPKIGWYEDSAKALHHVFGEDTPRFTTLLAATSPQTSVESNLKNATAIWNNWNKAGRPNDPGAIVRIMGESVQGGKGEASILPAWVNNTVTALSAPPEELALSGPKVNEFASATAGDLNRYVLDAWMANASGVPQNLFKAQKTKGDPTGYGVGYLGPSAVGRSVADQLTEELGKDLGFSVKPSHVQEAVWSWAKGAYEARAAEGIGGRTVRELVEAGEITPELIDAVPDFSTLLGDEGYSAPLRESGYGSKIDTLSQLAGGGKLTPEQRAGFIGAVDQDALLRAADRLDRLYDARTHASRTGAYRGRPSAAEGAAGGGYTRTGGARGGAVRLADGSKVAAVHSPRPEFTEALRWQREGYQPATPDFHELVDDRASRLRFSEGLSTAKASRGRAAASVDVLPPNDYRGHRMFMTPEGGVGFSIGPDGELNSVVAAKGSPHRGVTDAALNVATSNGATWLSAFDIGLPQKYARAGFKPVARVPFNDEYAPDGWDYEAMKPFNGGKPDVVFMVYDPDFTDPVSSRTGGKVMDDYEKAQEFTRSQVGKGAAKKAPTTAGDGGEGDGLPPAAELLNEPPAPSKIRAYHGSPHDFDRFDLSKIGTGEGAQVYGHGLYFAESEGVAKSYRDSLAPKKVVYDGGETSDDGTAFTTAGLINAHRGDVDAAIAAADRRIAWAESRAARFSAEGKEQASASNMRDADSFRAIRNEIEALRGKSPKAASTGHMYEVNINASPDDFLDWDKPLSEQSEKVRGAFEDRLREYAGAAYDSQLPNFERKTGGELLGQMQPRGPHQYDIANRQNAAMRERGVAGIKYLDNGSRAAGDGSRNYVVFDEKLIDILRKYGLGGLMLGGSALPLINSMDGDSRQKGGT